MAVTAQAPSLRMSTAAGRWAVGVTVLGSGIAALDATVVNIALPTIGREFGTGVSDLQWVISGYTLTLAAFLLIGGTLGDRYVAYVLPGVVVFGLGLAVTVAPLTATAMSSAPAEHAGVASAVNNDVARFGGLLATALLPPLAGITGTAYLHPVELATGFRTAVLIAAGLSAAGGILAAVTIRNRPRPVPEPGFLHCALDAPPLRTTAGEEER